MKHDETTEARKRWLTSHGYCIEKTAGGWSVTDPLDDPDQGFLVECPTEAEAINEAYEHICSE